MQTLAETKPARFIQATFTSVDMLIAFESFTQRPKADRHGLKQVTLDISKIDMTAEEIKDEARDMFLQQFKARYHRAIV